MAPKLIQSTVMKVQIKNKDQTKKQNLLRLSQSKMISTDYYHRRKSSIVQE